jgi:hypothetical protein
MKKHPFNIFPEASEEDFNRLLSDIRDNGYDSTQPITVYEGMILDGWNRWRACDILNVPAKTVEFDGDKSEAIRFMMRTNKRRNLNKGQWATIAVEADELMAEIARMTEQERRKLQAETQRTRGQRAVEAVEAMRQKIDTQPRDRNESRTATKAAELFNTNRTYINQAAKVKAEAPEAFEKVKAGKMRLQDAVKEVARKPVEPEWLLDEIERRKQVERGESVVANFQRDKHLIQWASQQGHLVSIDRTSKWGNPFVLGPDGDRETVCDCFEEHYAPHKESFRKHSDELRGKVLGCHCYPERCHGNSLVRLFVQ